MKVQIVTALILISIMACNTPQIQGELLINHVGYDETAEKKVIFQTQSDVNPKSFVLITENGEEVFKGSFEKGGKVDNWHTGNAYQGMFSEFKTAGKYKIKAKVGGSVFESTVFEIKQGNVVEKALPLIMQGFKSIHPAEKYEEWDSNIPFHGDRKDRVDVHGGWYDASGDFSKYLTHLTYTNYMVPQQTPMVAYNLLTSAQNAKKQGLFNEKFIKEMVDEAAYGADFLMRMQDDSGYFYTIVFDNWSKDPTVREICSYETQAGTRNSQYQAAFREGAGISIAALAKLSANGVSGEYSSKQYLAAAEKGFAHLLKNNTKYCDNGIENIIDDYCALMASSELYLATQKDEYLKHAQLRVQNLNNRISADDSFKGWFRADASGERSYFHAAEAGYPVIALCRYLDIEKDDELRKSAIKTIQNSIDFELTITNGVYNPFGYPRQYVKAIDEESKRAAFFVPHQNESGYWYQGENARIASLAAAFNIAQPYMLSEQQEQVQGYVQNQINWILGLNPYNMCMLDGLGYNNPEYLEPHDWNYVGGIANGITAGVEDETDIAFLPDPQKNDGAERWRWPEQWIPHAGWFILMVTTVN